MVKCTYCDMVADTNGEEWICGICKMQDDSLLDKMRVNCASAVHPLQLPPLIPCAIIGGGPSLKKTYKELYGADMDIFATNNTLKFLRKKRITPDFYVMIDGKEVNAEFVNPPPTHKTMSVISSQCHPRVFENLEGTNVRIWHTNVPKFLKEQQEILLEFPRSGTVLVGGGSTVGLRAMMLAYLLGYKEFHLYGMDSSLSKDAHHAYTQKHNSRDLSESTEVTFGDKSFRTSPWMYRQSVEFHTLWWKYYTDLGCRIVAHGSGLLPYICDSMNNGNS